MDINLLYKYISGDATDKEKEKVVDWVYADEANLKKYMRLRKIYDASAWIEIPENVNQLPVHKKTRKSSLVLQFSKIAAIAILVLISSYWGYKQYFHKTEIDDEVLTMIMPAGQYGQLVLPDGSLVWLNAQSRLEFPSRFGSDGRNVFLDGEAFFEVAANEDNPFIVHTKNYSVKALGTKFNVRSFDEGEHSRTSLLTGAVDIELNTSKKKFSLHPNEQLDYQNGEVSLSPISNLSYFEWKDGLLCFENESMKDLLMRLGQCYAIEFEIKNESILTDKYTGKFKIKDGIEQALKVLQLRSDFSYRNKGDYIIIEKS
ncbi:FecR family protein, partial [Dysgonomonas sp. Marseille-P4677]|uniref:FecR family protein n=1 Tax=Dysgonomonas sp. Marseille-P4677 TaxID=2364790 RepID=UPI0019130C18